jgi:hypothetical protein
LWPVFEQPYAGVGFRIIAPRRRHAQSEDQKETLRKQHALHFAPVIRRVSKRVKRFPTKLASGEMTVNRECEKHPKDALPMMAFLPSVLARFNGFPTELSDIGSAGLYRATLDETGMVASHSQHSGVKFAVIMRMKILNSSVSALSLLLLASLSPLAVAFPATQERAELTLNFTLSPLDPLSTASGAASINVMRLAGVEYDDALVLTLSGLPDGTYTLEATTKSDPLAPPVLIGSVVVSAIVDPAAPPAPPLTLPEGLRALDIAMLTISDATPTVLLAGGPSEDVARWRFFGNRPLRVPAVPPGSLQPVTGSPSAAKVHGHVLVQAAIVENAELRRKFLLVGHGLPSEATLTVNLDGDAVGEVTTTKRGKAMLKSLEGDFRLAGTHLLTLTDADGNVVAEADFFPSVE